MREQIHHETVTPAEWLFCSDGLLPCFRDNETGIRNGPAFFQQARRAPLHGSPHAAGLPNGGQSNRAAAPPSTAAQPHLTAPGGQRRSPASQQPPATGGAAPVRPDKRRTARQRDANPLHSNPRRPAAQPPLHGHPATGHEMAGKPARQPPAGPPSPAPSCINPPGHQRAPPSPLREKRVPVPPYSRRPPPLRETRTTPPARAAEHARPLHPFCGGSTRRAPLRRGKRGCGGAENILFLIPEYPLTTA